ncbi:GMC oxidoreductase [Nocardiopsis baichengensis]|uniref:GMC oxidoreductase n=1 Tax=Nocardiopsis baichengensis TaxID=280240 RepID=UPI000345C866|nr:GMC oxidoreductase [Nocardiopsis baichengensis]
MPLPVLAPTREQTTIQSTAFTTDALGRHLCNTWDEATTGGPPFSAVIAGAGAYGAYLAVRIRRARPGARVLLLDAGGLLIPEHVQNMGRLGLDVPAPIPPEQDPGAPREAVWGLPWRGNVAFPGTAYCLGGKSVYWGGWCPRLTAGDLVHWPGETASDLERYYLEAESETGVVPGTDFIFGELNDALAPRFAHSAVGTPFVESALGDQGVEPAPLAVQGEPPVSGLFSFDKYSALPLLFDALRADVAASGGDDARRGLFLVPRAHVVRLHASGGTVHTVEADAEGVRRFLPVTPDCAVVLAAGAVESTRMALLSFPAPLMGRNLMAHVRSDFTVRLHRSELPALPPRVQTAAALVRGLAPSGRFHVQVTASTSAAGSDELLFRMVPDIEQLRAHLANTDPDWVALTLRCVGEMHGDRTAPVHDPAKSWIDLSPFESDEFGAARAFVNLGLPPEDEKTWQSMDEAALAFASGLAESPRNVQYLYDGAWQSTPFPLQRPFPEWHRGLGTTFHEAGTLWMGEDPASSVTDPSGRFHHVSNAYACDQSVFPTVGSANPVLTGLALAARLAERLPA